MISLDTHYLKMPYQDIDDVIASLQLIVTHCKKQHSKAGYFAALYTRMTMAVKEGIAKNAFEDGKRMEQLDICFAERYLLAWQNYSIRQPCTQSWQYTFESCSNYNNTVLQYLLLGINTHINLDPAIAAATIAPGKKIYDLEKDFNRINDVIVHLADDIQECLARVWLPMRLITKIANGKAGSSA